METDNDISSFCIFCLTEIIPTQSYELNSSASQRVLLKKYRKNWALSICELLDIQNHHGKIFEESDYCSECHELILNIDSTIRSIKILQEQLRLSRKIIRKYLVLNYGSKSSSSIKNKLANLKVDKKLVAQLSKITKIIKNKTSSNYSVETSSALKNNRNESLIKIEIKSGKDKFSRSGRKIKPSAKELATSKRKKLKLKTGEILESNAEELKFENIKIEPEIDFLIGNEPQPNTDLFNKDQEQLNFEQKSENSTITPHPNDNENLSSESKFKIRPKRASAKNIKFNIYASDFEEEPIDQNSSINTENSRDADYEYEKESKRTKTKTENESNNEANSDSDNNSIDNSDDDLSDSEKKVSRKKMAKNPLKKARRNKNDPPKRRGRKKLLREPDGSFKLRFRCNEGNCINEERKFHSVFSVKKHIESDHGGSCIETPYHCMECSSQFKNLVFLEKHKNSEHSEPIHPCISCNKKFGTKWALKRHLNFSHSAKSLQLPKCSICHKSFENGDEIPAHEEGHKKLLDTPYPFACLLCPVNLFTNNLDLQKHVRQEHETDLFKCPQCSHVCTSKHNLRGHLITHNSSLSFECPTCAKKFRARGQLTLHILTHSEPQFPCDFGGCTKKFYRASRLKRHKDEVHKLSGRSFKCLLCPREYPAAEILKRHQMHHSEIRPFLCHICSFRSKSKRNLITHIKTHERAKRNNRVKFPQKTAEDLEVSPAQIAQNSHLGTENVPSLITTGHNGGGGASFNYSLLY